MKRSEIKEFFYLYDKIDKLAEEIFNKFEKANLLSDDIYKPQYKRIEFNECGVNLVIRYEESSDYCFDTLEIPFDIIYNNKIEEYIENVKREKIEKAEAKIKAMEEYILAKEKAEYERLKAKFENE